MEAFISHLENKHTCSTTNDQSRSNNCATCIRPHKHTHISCVYCRQCQLKRTPYVTLCSVHTQSTSIRLKTNWRTQLLSVGFDSVVHRAVLHTYMYAVSFMYCTNVGITVIEL